jgi:hypothetical protein
MVGTAQPRIGLYLQQFLAWADQDQQGSFSSSKKETHRLRSCLEFFGGSTACRRVISGGSSFARCISSLRKTFS